MVMKAIELSGEIDKDGNLKVAPVLSSRNRRVKVIILLAENEEAEDTTWLEFASSNPAFDFLKDPAEDIYTLSHRRPLND